MLKENLYSMSEGIAEYSRAKLYKDQLTFFIRIDDNRSDGTIRQGRNNVNFFGELRKIVNLLSWKMFGPQ